MTFLVDSYNYECGTQKALCIHDVYGSKYWIPRSQIKIIDKKKLNPLIKNYTLTIFVPDWIIYKNDIPIFKLEELELVR